MFLVTSSYFQLGIELEKRVAILGIHLQNKLSQFLKLWLESKEDSMISTTQSNKTQAKQEL